MLDKFKTHFFPVSYTHVDVYKRQIDTEVDEAFAKSTVENASFNTPTEAKENLKIVYTSLHGTSIKAIPGVLSKAS